LREDPKSSDADERLREGGGEQTAEGRGRVVRARCVQCDLLAMLPA
jgi:hypothetical protein